MSIADLYLDPAGCAVVLPPLGVFFRTGEAPSPPCPSAPPREFLNSEKPSCVASVYVGLAAARFRHPKPVEFVLLNRRVVLRLQGAAARCFLTFFLLC